MIIGPSADGSDLLKSPQLRQVFLHLGMCPDRHTRTALADHIEALTRDEFVEFSAHVLQCVGEHRVALADRILVAPTGVEVSNVSFSTRSHENMKANSLVEKLRGAKTETSGGTAFQEEQDNGEWEKIVTKKPRFTRCIRHELVLFLRADAFVDSPQLTRASALTRFIVTFRDFYTAELFAAIRSQK